MDVHAIGKSLPLLVFALTLGMPSAGLAQSWPAKPVRLIVPFAAGSAGDIPARIFGSKLTEKWGQQVIVDNRPGAGGGIGSEAVAKAPADGYTLVMGASSSHSINVSLYSKQLYDPVRDFAPIALLVQVPNVLAVHPSLPVRNVKELIALAKARPGQLTFGSSGSGTSNHLSGELMKYMAGIDVVHVPYKGSPQSLVDAISGQITMVFAPMLTARPHVKSGKLKALGITPAQRSAAAPELPTIAESGLRGYDSKAWFGVLAPAGTPRELITRLNGDLMAVLAMNDVRESLIRQGADPVARNSPDDFAAYIKSEIAKWAKVIKASGAKVD